MARTFYNIVDKDKGYADLKRRIMGKDNPTLEVGVFQKAGSESYGDSGATVLEVAYWNEFGTLNPDGSQHIPPRPFIRLYFDSQAARIQALAKVAIQQVVSNKLTKSAALARLGIKLSGEIQQSITLGYFGLYPENAPATIAKKGSSTPLVDTGQLRSAISYRLDLGFRTFT